MDTLMCREGLRNLLLSKSELVCFSVLQFRWFELKNLQEFSMQSVKVTTHREIKTDLKVDRSEKHRSLRFQTDFLDAQESVKRASLRWWRNMVYILYYIAFRECTLMPQHSTFSPLLGGILLILCCSHFGCFCFGLSRLLCTCCSHPSIFPDGHS